MLKHRVIPCLLMDNRRLVKGRRFRDHVYVGDPINVIKIFNEKEVDELILLDITVTKKGLEPDFDYISEIAGECFMPLSYGGGIKSLEHARKLFDIGVEKVCLNSAVLTSKNLLREISEVFGIQSVCVVVDIKKNIFGKHRIYNFTTTRLTKLTPEKHIAELIENGAGEILVNNVQDEGTLNGGHTELVEKLSSEISVPLVMAGGLSSLQDIRRFILAGADSVAIGANFVFKGPHRAVIISYPSYGAMEVLLGDI